MRVKKPYEKLVGNELTRFQRGDEFDPSIYQHRKTINFIDSNELKFKLEQLKNYNIISTYDIIYEKTLNDDTKVTITADVDSYVFFEYEDEWYNVKHFKHDPESFNRSTYSGSYKCDQIDGVISLIRDTVRKIKESVILNFKSYCESISGTELINVGGSFGPGYGEEKLPVTLTSTDTRVVFSDLDGQFYTQDEYDQVYGDYLKRNGQALDGFTKENLEKVLYYLKNAM